MTQQYRISGAIFEGRGEKGPAYSGVIEIDGKKEYVSLWPKTSAKGVPYLSISEDKKRAEKEGATPPASGRSPFKPRTAPQRNDMDDDIPF